MTLPSEVYVSVYGGLRVLSPEFDLAIRPPRERVILALLIAGRGAAISMNDLVDTLWEEDPPTTALNQIQRHIGELRRLLEPGLPARMTGRFILASGEGYRVDTNLVDSDLERSSRLRIDAQTAAPDKAIALYVKALQLALSAPFAGLSWSVLNRPEFASAQRDRIALAIEAADCALTNGDPGSVVEAIETVAPEAPLDERLQGRLVQLLGRVGRRADAIAVYEAARNALRAELAIEPGAALRASLADAMTDHAVDRLGSDSGPRRLPPSPASLVQRTDSNALLAEAVEYAKSGGSALLAVSGMAGIGKTTLAVDWARSVVREFPDGDLFVNLRGFEDQRSVVSAGDALGQLLEDLGVSLAEIGADERSRRERFRVEMSTRRMVIVLDNAADAEHARGLLPGSPGTLVIVTSRRQLTSLVVRDGAIAVPLWRWSVEESWELLTKRLGSARVTTDGAKAAIDSIVRSCAGLPLALAMAAAASASGMDSGVRDIADRLAATASALDTLSLDRDDDLRAAFTWSYEILSPNAARVFRLASVHPGSSMSLWSLASISNLDLDATHAALLELTAASMMVLVARDRWALHDLLRLFGSELAQAEGSFQNAQMRLVDHFVHSTRQAHLNFRPPLIALNTDAPVPEAVEIIDSPVQAFRWFVLERQALLATFHVALSLGLDRQAALLAYDWRAMIQTVEPAQNVVPLGELAYSAAMRVGEPLLEANHLCDLGVQLCFTGKLDRGVEMLRDALPICHTLGDIEAECNILRDLGQFEPNQKLRQEYSIRAIEVAKQIGNPFLLAVCMLNFSQKPSTFAYAQEFLNSATEAMRIVDESHIEQIRSYVVTNLALAHFYAGNYEKVLELCELAAGALAWRVEIFRLSIIAAAAAGLGRRELVVEACARFDLLREANPTVFQTGVLDIELAMERIADAQLSLEGLL